MVSFKKKIKIKIWGVARFNALLWAGRLLDFFSNHELDLFFEIGVIFCS